MVRGVTLVAFDCQIAQNETMINFTVERFQRYKLIKKVLPFAFVTGHHFIFRQMVVLSSILRNNSRNICDNLHSLVGISRHFSILSINVSIQRGVGDVPRYITCELCVGSNVFIHLFVTRLFYVSNRRHYETVAHSGTTNTNER